MLDQHDFVLHALATEAVRGEEAEREVVLLLMLTQCPLRDAPPSRIAGLIDRLDARLHDVAIPLGTLVVFGGGFVFWCVEPRSAARARLQLAHEAALALGDGLLESRRRRAAGPRRPGS